MAIYTANRVVKTLTLHKEHCRYIKWDQIKSCGCGAGGKKGNQPWYCETHFTTDAVERFMGRKNWAIVLCDTCYRED